MTLTIKDLPVSIELDRAAMTDVHGGTGANSAVQTIGQAQQVHVPVGNGSMFGDGSATTIDVDVDADQHARNRSYQYNGDSFGLFLGSFPRHPA
jgi:hypothetical protein